MILRVDSVSVTKIKGGLRIRVDGTASTPGWTNIRLRRTSSAGGHLQYELIGVPGTAKTNSKTKNL